MIKHDNMIIIKKISLSPPPLPTKMTRDNIHIYNICFSADVFYRLRKIKE